MIVMINSEDISKHITAYDVIETRRGESVIYTLDGTAMTDRIGGFKRTAKITFGLIPLSEWEKIKLILKKKTISLNDGTEASMRLVGEIPNPYVFTDPIKGDCVTGMSIELEEI